MGNWFSASTASNRFFNDLGDNNLPGTPLLRGQRKAAMRRPLIISDLVRPIIIRHNSYHALFLKELLQCYSDNNVCILHCI